MKRTERPDAAAKLVEEALVRNRESYSSAGTAVASVKELTLCTIKANKLFHMKQAGEPLPKEEFDPVSSLKIAVGVAFGLFINPESEIRWEIPTPYGPVSGRTDLMDRDDDGQLIPAEVKITWSKHSVTTANVSAQYEEQLLGYCIAKGFRDGYGVSLVGPQRGRLYIGYMAGEWFGKINPVLTCYEYLFSSDELSQGYAEIERKTKAKLAAAQPSFADHFRFECKYCFFHKDKGGECSGEDGKTEGWLQLDGD